MPLYLGNQKIDKVLTEHSSFILDAPNELSEQETIIENLQNALKALGINIAENDDGILDSVELTAIEKLQRNNNALPAIISAIGNADFTKIYTIVEGEEPNSSIGKDGDLMMLVVNE